MSNLNAKNAAQQPFLPLMRELVRAYQAFTSFDARALREAGLTVPQADVLFTLGNTSGLTCREIGEKTLITKGTLTGVLDRMETKGLVRRVRATTDRRCVHIVLTRKGESLFSEIFPRHVETLKARFDRLSPEEMERLQEDLRRLRGAFS